MNALKGLGFTYFGIALISRSNSIRNPSHLLFFIGLASCIFGAYLIIDIGLKYKNSQK